MCCRGRLVDCADILEKTSLKDKDKDKDQEKYQSQIKDNFKQRINQLLSRSSRGMNDHKRPSNPKYH